MLVRIGIPASFPRFSAAARALGASILVSANAFWSRGQFRKRLMCGYFNGCDVTLDSAGFVAMALYHGFRWSITDYVRFAGCFPWTWWAAMDFCCEPEIASDRSEVLLRVERTATHLELCRSAALVASVKPPMPVLQGWKPDDYARCIEWSSLIQDLPALVGIGSVCRRSLHGPDGIISIVERLDRELPAGVMLHLFGVKTAAVTALTGHPRVHSTDSSAWDMACRRQCHQLGYAYSIETRIKWMRHWYLRQVGRVVERQEEALA